MRKEEPTHGLEVRESQFVPKHKHRAAAILNTKLKRGGVEAMKHGNQEVRKKGKIEFSVRAREPERQEG